MHESVRVIIEYLSFRGMSMYTLVEGTYATMSRWACRHQAPAAIAALSKFNNI